MSFFKLENVVYCYPQVFCDSALKDVSLTVEPGEAIGLIGPVGAGKSTLLKLLTGLIRPSNGRILFKGKPLNYKGKELRELRRETGVVFQFADNQIFEGSVWDEVIFGLKNFSFPAEEIVIRAEKALKSIGLNPEYFRECSPFDLSGGERKRLALASITALEPDFLLLDEPVSGLDRDGKLLLRKILKEHISSGKGFIMATHDLDFAVEICDRILILHDGKLIYDGGKSIFYDRNFLVGVGLEMPEIAEVWLEINNRRNDKMVFSVEEANRLMSNEV